MSTMELRLGVRASAIHGVGVCAETNIDSGQRLFRLHGRTHVAEYDENFVVGHHWYSVGRNRWIEPASGHFTAFVNHGCEPNVRWSDDRWFVTLRRIDAGEELLVDYATTELDPYWKMLCGCRLPRCRRLIVAAGRYDYLQRELRRVTPAFIRRHWRQASNG